MDEPTPAPPRAVPAPPRPTPAPPRPKAPTSQPAPPAAAPDLRPAPPPPAVAPPEPPPAPAPPPVAVEPPPPPPPPPVAAEPPAPPVPVVIDPQPPADVGATDEFVPPDSDLPPPPPEHVWHGHRAPPPMPVWTPMPPPPPKNRSLPWIITGIAVLALAATGYALQRERSDNKEARNNSEVQSATDRAVRSLQESLAEDADVDNTDGTDPKPMEISGGASGTTFTVQVPPGWDGRLVGQRVIQSAVEAFINGPPTRGFAPNFVIEVTTVDIEGVVLEDLVSNALRFGGGDLKKLEAVGDSEPARVGGEQALAQDYTVDAGTGDLSAQVVVTMHDGRVYFFYLSALPSQRSKVQPLFDEFLKTVEFQ